MRSFARLKSEGARIVANGFKAAGITQSTGLAIAGSAPSDSALVELYNGSGWTEVGDINTARYYSYGSKFTYDDSFISGGAEPPLSAKTELWDGTNWRVE